MSLLLPATQFCYQTPPSHSAISSFVGLCSTRAFRPSLCNGFTRVGAGRCTRRRRLQMEAMAMPDSSYKMNLNEYMVTLEKPLGIRFAMSVDGKFLVHSLMKGGIAEKSRIIMVGDMLKKASTPLSNRVVDIKDINDVQKILDDGPVSFSLILERPFSPFPIQQLRRSGDYDFLFNKGRVPVAMWSNKLTPGGDHPSERNGNSGFAVFSPKFLSSIGRELLSSNDSGPADLQTQYNTGFLAKRMSEIVCVLSETGCENSEWSYGSFPLEEYIKALDRAEGELRYNHSCGMQYSKITEQIFVGSCIQTEVDVATLSSMGVTAILNFQRESERANWGTNSKVINDCCHRYGVLMINYPIREMDSLDLRKKLPLCVGILLRLLRKRFRIFVTCTTGFDRSPACVVAYLHWVQDTALHVAHNFVTGLHTSRPDRAAIVWATWDLIALVENGKYNGPPTHAVTFVWNGPEGEAVQLVGEFTTDWNEPIKAVHKEGSRHEVECRLRHGKYHYKFIVGGHWRHSTSLPTELDQWGNINNVIRVGDTARIKFTGPSQQQIKDSTVIKVIERTLTEEERFMLAFASRRVAFAVCPIRFAPK